MNAYSENFRDVRLGWRNLEACSPLLARFPIAREVEPGACDLHSDSFLLK